MSEVDFYCFTIWKLDQQNSTVFLHPYLLLVEGCILSPCLFNLHAEYIMRNAEQEEAQAGINIAERNINNLRYADDTTVMAQSEEELKSLLMKVKRRVKKLA